jgi:16S rRNA (guanine966-N2)-methyltransferase
LTEQAAIFSSNLREGVSGITWFAGMRVIAGSAKGHRLQSVPGDATRPITDRVKEALFSILGDFVVDARVLDLFAGTGAVGIEALSRGAAEVVFVDKSPVALRTVRANLQRTRLADRAVVLHTDAFKYLAGPDQLPFDLIYVAPPQYKGLWAEALHVLDVRPAWLSNDPELGSGIVVAQIHPREYQELPLHNLVEYDQRKYGSTLLCFYELVEEQGDE